jgi:hypothetical protein
MKTQDNLTLVDKAMLAPKRKSRYGTVPTTEEIDLVLAWLQGKVTTRQAMIATGIGNLTNFRYRAATVMTYAVQNGLVLVQRVRA